MITIEDGLQRIQEMNSFEVRLALALVDGWKIVGEEVEVDTNGDMMALNPQGFPAVIPHVDEDMNLAFLLAQRYGLALVPQSNDKGGFDWLAIDLKAVVYDGDIHLEEKDSTGFSHNLPCIAICKSALAIEFLKDMTPASEGAEEDGNQSGKIQS